ncbi:MAG: AAA family ATPase [Desulfohalobiaceae bacterium]|nr:AAA family ATPase [Desulfohalobiaceae bacterium]
MIIKRFHLEAFGPFTKTSLFFYSQAPGLHLVYGPNESGKSSTLRAVKAWLFGFPERTPDNFLHANDRLCVSGTLVNDQGEELLFTRRKKRKGSILDAEGSVLEEGLIRAWLHGLDQETFEALFGLDHDGLAKGGAAILQEKGSAGSTLFAAGAGIASLEQVLSDLQEEGRSLYKPQGTKPELNAALKRYRELKKEINQAALSSHAWKEQERALRQAEAELQRTRQQKKDLQTEQQRLKRLLQAQQPLARLRDARAGPEQSGEVPALPDDFAERRRENQELLRQSHKALEAARRRLAEYHTKKQAIELNTELLDQSETIQELHQRLGAYRKGLADRRTLNTSRRQEEGAAAAIQRRIPPDLGDEPLDVLQDLLGQRREVMAHGNRLEVLQKERGDSAQAVQSCLEALERSNEALKRLPPNKDLSGLLQALETAAVLGDIDGTLEKQAVQAAADREAFSAGLHQLGFWQGRPEDLLALPLPLEAEVRAFKQAWDRLVQQGQELEKTRTELGGAVQELEKDIQAQELVGEVPSEEDLAAKRKWREQGWSLLRRTWLDGEQLKEEADRYAADASLVEAYEQAVQAADHTADRLRWESARVHEHARLQSELQLARRRLEALDRTEAEQAEQWDTLQVGWKGIWEPAGIEPGRPDVMMDWQSRIKEWRVRARHVLDTERTTAELRRKRQEARSALEGSLRDIGVQPPSGEALLPVLRLAKTQRENIEQTAQDRQLLEDSISRLDNDLAKARERAGKAEAALEDWQQQWGRHLQRLGLPPGESPDGVADFFEDLQDCLQHMTAAAGLTQRIQGIDQDSEELKRDVAVLTRRAAPDLAELPVDQAVESLNALLDRAQAQATTLTHYQESIQKIEEDIEAAIQDRDHAAFQLAELCSLARCDNQEALEAVEQRWKQQVELRKSLAAEELNLREIAQSRNLETFIAEVEQADPDSLPVRLQEVEQELERLEEAFGEQSTQVGELRKSFQDMDGSDQAAGKAEEAEELLARIRRQAGRFARLRLASLVLEEAVERYRSENQDPVLSLAGRYFNELTLNSFAGLRQDLDDKGGPIIVGLREDGQRIQVEGMSDGTRDQLYLALRLASLEHRLKQSEAIPFIVDDILINFDEERSKAALQALARLSAKNQVLLFSHHRQVADTVRELGIGQVHAL